MGKISMGLFPKIGISSSTFILDCKFNMDPEITIRWALDNLDTQFEI